MAQRAVRPTARRLRPSAWREALPVLRESETIKAAALAAAYVVAIGLGLVFTILAARILGDSYGALARITSFYLILTVPGLALQAAVAREVAVGDLGGSGALAASMRGWLRQIVVFGLIVVVAAVLLRAPLADLLHVDQEWAAATVPLTAVLWLAVSMQRGLLQGLRAYTPVGVSIVGEGARAPDRRRGPGRGVEQRHLDVAGPGRGAGRGVRGAGLDAARAAGRPGRGGPGRAPARPDPDGVGADRRR